MEFLEFEEPAFFEAFMPPVELDGMTLVGENGESVTGQYLFERWYHGKSHSKLSLKHLHQQARQVWEMDGSTRQAKIKTWTEMLLEEQLAKVQSLITRMDNCQEKLAEMWNEKTRDILLSKRIIGCTTTAAAMNAKELSAISPGIVLLEEAGEILESHVLTALGPHTKKLIMIGDHQQLRPKINNYALSVEKGSGYDLNRSLFGRLVESGYPHSTLAKQHRMVPEISSLVRKLTYPDLLDDDKTLSRPAPRGLQDRVIFLDHTHAENNLRDVSDRNDVGGKGSKQNSFEVQLVLKIIKYLGQQGYGTDKLVVLTPYLGQLHLLREELLKDTDPVLNDLDSYDLVRAGLISQASARHAKRPIKLSTIDNYQGEESEIVIATLTRSNKDGDIGFMSAPQRLNVLLSRARDVLIMIGNSKTFIKSRKGKEVWKPFINQLQENGHLYDGLPVKCEQHPQRTAVLGTSNDFDTLCPDGGCDRPCGTKLSCGLHDCPHKCHQLSDHSKMDCHKVVDWTCTRNHKLTRPCSQQRSTCYRCAEEDKELERRRKRDMQLDLDREAKQKAYAHQLALIKDEIEHERRLQKDSQDEEERQRILKQQRQDLERLKARAPEQPQQNHPVFDGSSEQYLSPSKEPPQGTAGNTGSSESTNGSDGSKALSSAEQDWEYQKQYEGAQSEELDKLMAMIGLERIKTKFLAIKSQVDAAMRQKVDFKGERFGSVLLGNPGTGKTTVARLYAKFLTSMGIIPGSFIVETTGSRLANGGVSGCEKQINNILNDGGGVVFIDGAYQLAQGSGNGTQVLDFLLAEVERLTGKVVVVLAGYRRQMEKFFAHNPGQLSRFPHEFVFEDYTEPELRLILQYQINQRFQGRMKAEQGMGSLYCRMVARRISRQRGHEGFGNARTVENTLSTILQRQAKRLTHERRKKVSPDDLLLTKEDLIGPEPSKALNSCAAWKQLQGMIGLASVKNTVRALLDSIQSNYERELKEEPLVEFTLNRVFLGSPGTGKTSIESCRFCKVLVIDEAYGLSGGGSRNAGGFQTDPYKTAVVDAVVAEVQSNPGDDRCVLLLGYQDQVADMFQNVNPGLSRRFPMDSAFIFEDFSDDELGEILDLKLKQQGFEVSNKGRKVALEILSRARNRPTFGDAGEIDILLNGAKIRQQQRRSSGAKCSASNRLEPEDLDPEYDRGERTETNIPMLFQDIVGCETIVNKLEGYRQTVKNMRDLDMDPKEQVPFNILFRGPPGTGKTSTARKMGKVYYDMCLLSSAEVIESSATDLVLLIDEAYRLAEGQFAKEAMDEIVDCITKPKFFQKLIIILAGYDNDINCLMTINPGLTSRFPEELEFAGLSPNDCLQLLTKFLQKKKSKLRSKVKNFNMDALESQGPTFGRQIVDRFSILAQGANWANARDVQTLGKAIFGEALRSMQNRELSISETLILSKVDGMISERTSRARALSTPKNPITDFMQSQAFNKKPAHPVPTTTSSPPVALETTEEKKDAPPPASGSVLDTAPRDAGVSDDVWQQLEQDKQAEKEAESLYQTVIENENTAEKELQELPEPPEDDSDPDHEAKRERERRRLEELRRRARLEELRREREEKDKARREEQRIQQKLRQMGVCVAGFRWIKQASGYRCARGSHYISNEALGI
ncbi:hypothetical protein ASPVEDRAFT_81003 [Aspergillus versicolor CBS 583.65]|uniref:AAA+ ATPase domain-containing protein n=1 Tax=Aspergillus versicolor CBS 583.65 TaxID=1036611 RepID=A0A1L9PD37_ASPVE|nr:uncharacterized protein ASPVEDRAFT_81003 [Aspergillus versicolor CBS 583.65]OJI99392.1 hypothetical protein ASPVEDRAFT_81003 [Aspergillus versicolor CBS 583.65]